MKTRLTRSPRVAAEFIRRGEVVAFPTETVFGLAAAIFNEDAITKVFAAKGRPADNPLIAHVATFQQIQTVASLIPPVANDLIKAFFPGPLTVVLPKSPAVPKLATAGLETVGVRMPSRQLAAEFIRECGTPIVAPSANLSGRPSPTTWQAVKSDLDGRISCILIGQQTEVGLESTVVDCTGEHPLVLRAGAVTLEDLRLIAPATDLASDQQQTQPRSPGLKYGHYSPRARVHLVDHPTEAGAGLNSAWIGLTATAETGQFRLNLQCGSVTEYAHGLFKFFRECDQAGIDVIYCERVPVSGLGLALMDRLRRASGQL